MKIYYDGILVIKHHVVKKLELDKVPSEPAQVNRRSKTKSAHEEAARKIPSARRIIIYENDILVTEAHVVGVLGCNVTNRPRRQ